MVLTVILALASVFVGLCDGQFPVGGACPTVTAVQDFDATQYVGRWYENSKYFTFFEFGGSCVTADYEAIADGKLKVTNSFINLLGKKSIVGEAVPVDASSTVAKYKVTFQSVSFTNIFNQMEQPDGNYWVLSTDYTSYAVVWRCKNQFFLNRQNLWILTRDREPTQAVVDLAKEAIETQGLTTVQLIPTRQTECTNLY